MIRNISTTLGRVVPIVLAGIISGCATPLGPPTAPPLSADGSGSLASAAGSGLLGGGALLGGRGSFYPLQLGNHWRYRKRFVYAVVPYEGDPSPPYESNSTIDRDLICVERRDGRDYVVEQVEERDADQTFRSWIRYRQDRTGLYEADVWLSEIPACADPGVSKSNSRAGRATANLVRRLEALIPAGPPSRRAAFLAAAERVLEKLALVDAALAGMPRATAEAGEVQSVGPGELTRLRYPLHPGTRWTIRNEPSFKASVEGTDVLPLPAGRLHGYRIRISFDGLGPNDDVRVWYGTSGFLQLVVHVEYQAIDVFGQPQGWVIVDQTETLEELQLSGLVSTWPPVTDAPLSR